MFHQLFSEQPKNKDNFEEKTSGFRSEYDLATTNEIHFEVRLDKTELKNITDNNIAKQCFSFINS